MRFINVHTFKVEEFFGGWPAYGILSHTWNNDEVSLQDIQSLDHARTKAGFRKIEWCCSQAQQDDLGYVWVDTCCIDKTSSAELTEAINSMYQLYKTARVCYAYLADVSIDDKQGVPPDLTFSPSQYEEIHSDPGVSHLSEKCLTAFRSSRWFTRGWTLQELIAPGYVVFYDRNWCWMERRSTLVAEIVDVTGIDLFAFGARELHSYSVAQKLSWAARRQTTRAEDEAYCLLGLLDINMPLLYGEGRKAFMRLQQEVIKQTDDHSIFVWTSPPGHPQSLLAPRPSCFRHSNDIVRTAPPPGFDSTSYTFGNRGLSIRLPCLYKERSEESNSAQVEPVRGRNILGTTVRSFDARRTVVALLNCRPKSQFLSWLGLNLREPEERGDLWVVDKTAFLELVFEDLAAEAEVRDLLIQPHRGGQREYSFSHHVSAKIFVNLSHHPLASSKAVVWAYPSNQWNASAGLMELSHRRDLDFGAVLMDLEVDDKLDDPVSPDHRRYLFVGFTLWTFKVGIIKAELVQYQDWTTFRRESIRAQQWHDSHFTLPTKRRAHLQRQVQVSEHVAVDEYGLGLSFQGDYARVLRVQVTGSEVNGLSLQDPPAAGGRFEPPRSKATKEGFLSLESPVWSLEKHCMKNRKKVSQLKDR